MTEWSLFSRLWEFRGLDLTFHNQLYQNKKTAAFEGSGFCFKLNQFNYFVSAGACSAGAAGASSAGAAGA